MKVLLVNGSPHREGCIHSSLSEVGGALNNNGVDSEIFWIGNRAVQGCIACWKCHENGAKGCVFQDKLYTEFIRKMRECDGIVIGAPVYYAGPPGALCAILDRVFFFRAGVLSVQTRRLCGQLPPGRRKLNVRPVEQILHHPPDAGGFQPILELDARPHSGRAPARPGRTPDHAHSGEQYGISAENRGALRRAAPRAGALDRNQLHLLKLFSPGASVGCRRGRGHLPFLYSRGVGGAGVARRDKKVPFSGKKKVDCGENAPIVTPEATT